MSEIYDNWERLVAAVLKKEEIWELCHAPSRSPSISCESSSDFSSGTVSFRLEIEQLELSDFSSSFSTSLQIEELIEPDEHVRNSFSSDHQSREIVPIPRQENRITRISQFQENKMTSFCFPFFRGIFQSRNRTGSVYMKVVLKLAIANHESRVKAMKKAVTLSGVESVALEMKDKKLIVIGDVDPVALTTSLRKLCHTELLSVGRHRSLPPRRSPRKVFN